jgi:hypothetical protein
LADINRKTKLKKAGSTSSVFVNLSGIFLTCMVIGYLYTTGFRLINQDQPALSPSSFEVAKFVKQNTGAKTVYLLVAQQDEAEWFPYLLERQPLVGQWGSEWLGTYYQQTGYLRDLRQCEREQDLTCLYDFMAQVGKTPDYLITVTTRNKLSNALALDPGWKNVYENSRYLVWRYTE